LKGTRKYARLRKAYDSGFPPPKLTTTLSTKTCNSPATDKWGDDFDSLTVHVERVISYWSRTFKSAETHYSMMEREALAVKEGLVKFQPFIKGKSVLLVTDHSALQWARTYENSKLLISGLGGCVFSIHTRSRNHT